MTLTVHRFIGPELEVIHVLFNRCFVNELDLSGMAVDVALRRYQAHFRLPGEAQKIERLVEAFARRYCVCNTDFVQRLRTQDTVRESRLKDLVCRAYYPVKQVGTEN